VLGSASSCFLALAGLPVSCFAFTYLYCLAADDALRTEACCIMGKLQCDVHAHVQNRMSLMIWTARLATA
jgi:hypothetical protein